MLGRSLHSRILIAVTLSSSAYPAFCAGPQTAAPLAVSSTWSGDTANRAVSDNSGRQLAIAMPLIPAPHHSSLPAVKPYAKGKSAHKDQVIKITVPATVDETADVCLVNLKKVSTVGQQKAVELYKWALALHKHMTAMPVMTPLGGPYQPPPSAQTKLYLTGDGRLKTVVKQ